MRRHSRLWTRTAGISVVLVFVLGVTPHVSAETLSIMEAHPSELSPQACALLEEAEVENTDLQSISSGEGSSTGVTILAVIGALPPHESYQATDKNVPG